MNRDAKGAKEIGEGKQLAPLNVPDGLLRFVRHTTDLLSRAAIRQSERTSKAARPRRLAGRTARIIVIRAQRSTGAPRVQRYLAETRRSNASPTFRASAG